jgi:hypothetical protein
MFGRGKKYRIPPHLLPEVQTLQEFKDPVKQAHVRLRDGREFVVRIWYPDRVWAIQGYTYLPFSGSDIESVYQTKEDEHGESGDDEFMFLDDWVVFQLFCLPRWQLKLREIMNWILGARRRGA